MFSKKKNVSSWFYPLGIDQMRKVVCIWQTWKGKLFQKWSKLLHFQSLQRETFAWDIYFKEESRVSFSFILTDFLNCFIFSPIRREDCGVSPEAPDADPWPGAERWWVSVQTSAVLHSLLINVLLWHFHKFVYLHDSTDNHHLNFQYRRPSEGLRAWGMLS